MVGAKYMYLLNYKESRILEQTSYGLNLQLYSWCI